MGFGVEVRDGVGGVVGTGDDVRDVELLVRVSL